MIYWKDKLIKMSDFDSVAQLGLANFYFEGFFGEIDVKMGANFLFKSAVSNGDAQYQLADLYCSGLNGFSTSIEHASYWLRRAYKNRNASAYYEMSRYYRNINQIEKSRVLLEKSADLGLVRRKMFLNTVIYRR